MPADEFADVVHLSVNNEPPLFFTPRALRHFVPGEVARGLPLGRGLGSHRGRATTRAGWVAAVRSTHRTRGVARAGLAGSGSGSAGALPDPRSSRNGFSSTEGSRRRALLLALLFVELRGAGASPRLPAGPARAGAWGGSWQAGGGPVRAPPCGLLARSPPDPTFRLEPFRLELTGGAAAWITVPVKTPGCGALLGEEGAEGAECAGALGF